MTGLVCSIPYLKHSLKGYFIGRYVSSLFDRDRSVCRHFIYDGVEKISLMVLPLRPEHVVYTADNARKKVVSRFLNFGLRDGYADSSSEVSGWKQSRSPSLGMWIGAKLRTLFLLNLVNIPYRSSVHRIRDNVYGYGGVFLLSSRPDKPDELRHSAIL